MRTTTRRQLLATIAVTVSLMVLATCTWAQAVGEAGVLTPKKQPASGLGSAISGAAQQAGSAMGGQTSQPAQPMAPTPGMEQTSLDQAVTEGAVPLRVMVGKSILVNTTDRLIRVSVTDPAIADALVVTPTQLLIHGRAPGEVSLVLWDAMERSRSFDLRVDVDASSAAEEIRRIFPGETINVSSSRSAIVLSGHVTTEDVAKNAGSVAGAFSKAVVNVLTFGPLGAQEILLEVKFAELNRTALRQFGINLFSTHGKMLGETGTGQFGQRGVFDLSDTHVFGLPTTTVSSDRQITPLNVFLFRPDVHVGLAIQALQQKNLAQLLAEPNLIALNGKEASFLAGGEFPIPIVQGGGNVGNVTIVFKEFGVRLKFTPVIQPNGNIRLKVMPEVSSLDFANGITLSGFTIPGLTTRRAETELELQDGQSFVIAGLIDNRIADIMSKVPILGDIPILGQFFRSKDLQKRNSELLVLVTARRISPSDQRPDLPKFPQQWLDQNKFDQGTKPDTGMKPSGGGK